MGTSTCSGCGQEVAAGQRFCGFCGAGLARACPSCGRENPAGFRFCGSCGGGLDAPPAAEAAPTEERRWATVLFADLSGFTSLSERTDPEEVRLIVDRCLSGLGAIVERSGGSVARLVGDELMAIYGAPVAHGADTERAVRGEVLWATTPAAGARNGQWAESSTTGADAARIRAQWGRPPARRSRAWGRAGSTASRHSSAPFDDPGRLQTRAAPTAPHTPRESIPYGFTPRVT